MQKLHEYTVFEIEMNALKKWLTAIKSVSRLHFNPDAEFYRFLQSRLPGVNWQELDTNQFQYTDSTKALYLLESGCTYTQIQNALGLSPTTISKIKKGYGFAPTRPVNPTYMLMIAEWKRLRPLLPNEIFIKWLK
jgi:uncharacterized protein YerC